MPKAAKPFRQRDSEPIERRGSANSRGYNHRWRKASKAWLSHIENVLCAECKRHGRETLATLVDHIIPHRGDQAKFWDQSNWQPLCDPCHNQKTARGE